MITACLFVPLFLAQLEEPPRLKTVLPNKSVVLVETFPSSKLMSVQLFASSRGVADTRETHGFRHLLEHLIAKGARGDLDMRLEAKGVFLRADTYRDFMHVSVTGPAGDLDLALDAVKEILQPPHWTAEQLAKEAHVISEELALLPDSILFSNAMWEQAYGDAGTDPMGDDATIAKATPELLEALHKKHFAAPNLVLVVDGPLGVDEMTRKAAPLLSSLAGAERAAEPPPRAGKAGRTEVAGGFGEARGAIAPGIGQAKTAWMVAAGFAVAALLDGATFTYTPSVRGGLVVVGQTANNNGLGRRIDEMSAGDRAAYFESAKNMAREWIAEQLASPISAGLLRGELLVENRSARPETLLENIDGMTLSDFLKGFAAFDKDSAVIGVGVAR